MWLTTWQNGATHVVPCYDEGEPLHPHIASHRCCCQPELEFKYDEDKDETTGMIVIHNQIH